MKVKEDKVEHQKYYNADGEEVPSVTTVLKLLNKPQLMNWANWLGFNKMKYNTVLDEAAEIGTMTHALIERYSLKRVLHLDILDNCKYDKTPEKVAICFRAFNTWLKEKRKNSNVKFLYSELQVSGVLYGGTIDCICEIDDEIYIIDYKTTSSIYPSMFIQLAAYYYLVKDEIDIDKVAILRLDKKTGGYEFYEMKVEKLFKYYEMFALLLEMYYVWENILINDWNKNIKEEF